MKTFFHKLYLNLRTFIFNPLSLFIAFAIFIMFGFVNRSLAQTATVAVYFVGCWDETQHNLYNVSFNTTPPSEPTCGTGDDPVEWSNGDILSVLTSGGLTGGGTSGNLEISIEDGGVTTEKIADAAVTSDKFSPTVLMNSSNGSITTSSSSLVDITNATVTLEVPENKEYDTIVTVSGLGQMNTSGNYFIISINRDSTDLRTYGIGSNGVDVSVPFSFTLKDTGLTEGSHVYKAKVASIGASTQTYVQLVNVVVQAFASP